MCVCGFDSLCLFFRYSTVLFFSVKINVSDTEIVNGKKEQTNKQEQSF